MAASASARFDEAGRPGVQDRSRAPHHCPRRTRDGVYGSPLTVADPHTRYRLACHGLPSTRGHGVRPVFERLFREYGLPRAVRTDNGVPFATTGLHGLSQLNVWWPRLGIQHQRIRPTSPQEREEVDDGIWSIHFCQVLLGRLDERDSIIRP